MKSITLFFLALFLGKGCDAETQQDLKNTVIEYSARTRGYSQEIVIKNQEITIDTYSRGDKSTKAGKITDADYKILIAEFQKLKLEQMKDLVAPTDKRTYDAAAYGVLTITHNDIKHISNSFDNGDPPAAIAKFVNKITAITKTTLQKK